MGILGTESDKRNIGSTRRTSNSRYLLSHLGIDCTPNSVMRIPRSIQLYEEFGYVHLFWRCHNKEFYLKNPKMKVLYLLCIRKALSELKIQGTLRIHCFCVMDNHFHMVISYDQGSKNLSEFMRKAHSAFGRSYNKLHKRSGKVAEGRPKTPLIENSVIPVAAGSSPVGHPIFLLIKSLKLEKR